MHFSATLNHPPSEQPGALANANLCRFLLPELNAEFTRTTGLSLDDCHRRIVLGKARDLVAGCDPTLPLWQAGRTRWFNTACFSTPANYTYGNAGRNILVGPPTAQIDASLFKNFGLAKDGRVNAQLRGEIFNVANTPQLNNPNAAIGTAAAGTISSSGSVATFARTQRQIQVALRISF